MSVSVLMPQLGESVTEGTVTRWLKKEGEQVTADEPLLEVSTDKVDTEIPAPASGILRGIVVDEDETVAVGAQLAVIEDADAPAATPAPAAPAPEPAAAPAEPAAPAAPPAPSYQPPAPAPAPAASAAPSYAPPSYAPSAPAYQPPAAAPANGGQSGSANWSWNEPSTPSAPSYAPPASPPPAAYQPPAAPAPAPAQPAPAQPAPSRQRSRRQRRRRQRSRRPSPRRPWPTLIPSPRRCRPATRRTSRPWCASSPPSTRSRSSRSPAPGSAAGSASRTSSTRPPSAGPTRPPRRAAAAASAAAPAPAAAPAATAAPSAAAAATRPAIVPDALRGTTQRMSRPRQVIAKRMVESLQTSAQLTTVVEVDVTNIARLRDRAKAAFEAREGVKLTFLPFFAQATVEALKIHPKLNSVINAETQEVTYHAAEHLGIAVDTDRGLMVPVIHGAGDLNIGGLARKIADLASRTRSGHVGPDELAGGTFTLTNTGSRGALFDTPIINLPQVGILGVGSVVKRAVVVDDPALGEVIAVRSMVYLALTYDHRLVDGADAARFLVTVKNRLEEGAFDADLGL